MANGAQDLVAPVDLGAAQGGGASTELPPSCAELPASTKSPPTPQMSSWHPVSTRRTETCPAQSKSHSNICISIFVDQSQWLHSNQSEQCVGTGRGWWIPDLFSSISEVGVTGHTDGFLFGAERKGAIRPSVSKADERLIVNLFLILFSQNSDGVTRP